MGSSGASGGSAGANLNAVHVPWPGDGVDATAAINAAIGTAVAAGVADGSYYAEVIFDAKTYTLSSACTKGIQNKGNSQIWLPLFSTTGQKFVLVLRGGRAATALPHWEQTTPQSAGTVLKTTLTGLTVDGTYGPPSVIGGPTPAQGYGYGTVLFNNMLIVIDCISVLTPPNPSLIGFNFSGMGEMKVTEASANASVTPGTGMPAQCTHDWAYGIYTPQMLNNDLCTIDHFSVEGFYSGLVLCEHAVVTSCRAIYCGVGILIVGCSSDSVWIGYASVEACPVSLQSVRINGGTGIGIEVGVLDIEDAWEPPYTVTYAVDDPDNILRGEIRVHRGAAPTVRGAENVKIIDMMTAYAH